jgi:two-component system chemotaxis response regulator CheV
MEMERNIMEGQTQEFEILEFKAGGNYYGVEVSDIREILPYNKKSTPVPNSHPLIEGIIMPRDFLIPIIDLVKSLNLIDVDDLKHEMLIVTGIYNMNIAFHVDSVVGIHRVTGTDITMPGKKVSTSVKGVVTGILSKDDKKIELLDLKKMINDINPDIA